MKQWDPAPVRDDAPVLFGNIAPDASMTFFNSAWGEVLGYDSEELRKLRLYDLVPLRLHVAVALVKRVLDPGTFGPLEFALRCKDGTHKPFLWYRHYNPEARTMFIAGRETREGIPTSPRTGL